MLRAFVFWFVNTIRRYMNEKLSVKTKNIASNIERRLHSVKNKFLDCVVIIFEKFSLNVIRTFTTFLFKRNITVLNYLN